MLRINYMNMIILLIKKTFAATTFPEQAATLAHTKEFSDIKFNISIT